MAANKTDTGTNCAAPNVELGSGAGPQKQGKLDLDTTNHAPREAAGDDGLLRLVANMVAGGNDRYLSSYRVTLTLNVESSPEGGDA